MSETHQWVNRYFAPLAGGQVISSERPGEKIAKAITEIQSVIDGLTGADGKGKGVITKDPDGVTTTESFIVLTGLRVSGDAIQMKTKTLTIATSNNISNVSVGEESGWITIDGGQGASCEDV